MMNAYRYAILWHCPKDATPMEVALDYCDTVEQNIRLFLRDKQPAYLWNALEVACRTPLASATQYDLLGELTEVIGETSVRRKVLSDHAFEAVRPAFTAVGESTSVN
jgi:hypothetical protein